MVTIHSILGLSWRLLPGKYAPAIIWVPATVIGLTTVLPLLYILVRTLGLGNDAWDTLFRSRTLVVLGNTAALTVIVTAASIAVSIPVAWLTVRTDLPFRRMWTVLTALPLVVPSYIGGFVIVAALGPRGMLQSLLSKTFNVEHLPEIYGLSGAALTLTLLSYPYTLITVRSALWGMDPALEEASRSLGYSRWMTFWKVTLPQLRPAISVGALLVGLYTLSDFGAVSLLRFDSFTRVIYQAYQSSFDRAIAAALSLLLVLVALALLTLEAWTRGRSRYYRSDSGSPRALRPVALGAWRWPALAFCGVVVILALALPMAVLGYWMVRGMQAGQPLGLAWVPMMNSISVSGLAAVLAVAVSVPVAVLAVRYPSRLSGFVERSAYIGFALPGIVVALGLVFFGVRYAPLLYQTLMMLVIAYVILLLPQAIGAVKSSFLQVSPRMEEAALSLGKRPVQIMVRVTLPLIRTGMLAGAGLMFLTAMKELPATLLLSPIGFKTLATTIWSATEEAFYTRAATSAILLVMVSSVPMAFLTLRESGRKG